MANEVKASECSLAECIEGALRDAAEAHKACCHSEVGAWEPFYALFVAKRIAPLLCVIQGLVDKALVNHLAPYVLPEGFRLERIKPEAIPVVATVRGKWSVSEQDGGPSWFLGK